MGGAPPLAGRGHPGASPHGEIELFFFVAANPSFSLISIAPPSIPRGGAVCGCDEFSRTQHPPFSRFGGELPGFPAAMLDPGRGRGDKPPPPSEKLGFWPGCGPYLFCQGCAGARPPALRLFVFLSS